LIRLIAWLEVGLIVGIFVGTAAKKTLRRLVEMSPKA
jgi:hypothetical protein